MARRRQANPLSTTQPIISSRTNKQTKPPLYQSSLEQFLRRTSTQNNKENQLTTPSNKRKSQSTHVQSVYFTKKRKLSSELPLTAKKSVTGTGIGTGEDASAPIVIVDDSEDGPWDGDTLFDSASTTRTLCVDLEKTSFGSKATPILEKLDRPYHPPPSATPPSRRSSSLETPSPLSENLSVIIPSSQAQERLSPLDISFGSKSKSILEELDSPYHPPSSATPPSRRSSSLDTSSPLSEILSVIIPSSQAQERLSPLEISLDGEKDRISDSPSFPLLNQTVNPFDEVIPSSQSQYLLPFIISPHRVRKFIGKPPSPSKELIPCSQEHQELDLVLLDKQREFGGRGLDSLLGRTQSAEMTDSFNGSNGEYDRPPSSDQFDLAFKRPCEDHATETYPDNVSIAPSESPATVEGDEYAKPDAIDPALECETSPSLMSSSLPPYGGNDSQYTFTEETCPSDIREFLQELDERTDLEPPQPKVPSDLEIDRTASQLGGNQPSSEDTLHSSSLPSMASSSQFSIGSSSQYTFIEASLPSDIAEFLNRLDDSLEPDFEAE